MCSHYLSCVEHDFTNVTNILKYQKRDLDGGFSVKKKELDGGGNTIPLGYKQVVHLLEDEN